MKLLMCPPLYYRDRADERERALAQWRGLYRLLRDQLEAEVDLLEPRPGVRRITHVARGGFVSGDTFLVSRFPDGAGTDESHLVENFFLVRGYQIRHLNEPVRFEGGRDLIHFKGALFLGLDSRQARSLRDEIQAVLGPEVVGLEMEHQWPGPLATAFCPVGSDQALFCPAAFTADACQKLESRITRLVKVEQDGSSILDSLVMGKNLIAGNGDSIPYSILEGLGITVYELPLDELSDAGGSASLALKLDER